MLAVRSLHYLHTQDEREGIVRVWQGRKGHDFPALATGVGAAATNVAVVGVVVVAAIPWHCAATFVRSIHRISDSNILPSRPLQHRHLVGQAAVSSRA